VTGTIVDEHDWMICGEFEEFVHTGWGTKWYRQCHVSCVCETVGIAKSIGLRKVDQREKDLRLGKEILYTLLW